MISKRGKRGFTIVEIVIALTIISIVSLTATSLVIASQRLSSKTRDRFFATGLCDNSFAVFTSSAEQSGNLEELFASFQTKLLETMNYNAEQSTDKTDGTISAQILLNENWEQVSDEKLAKNTCTYDFSVNKDDNKFVILKITVKIRSESIPVTESYTAVLEVV